VYTLDLLELLLVEFDVPASARTSVLTWNCLIIWGVHLDPFVFQPADLGRSDHHILLRALSLCMDSVLSRFTPSSGHCQNGVPCRNLVFRYVSSHVGFTFPSLNVCGKDLLLHRIFFRIMRSSLEQGHTTSHLMILRVYDMTATRLLVTIPSFHILALALRQHSDELRLRGSQVLFTLHELLLHMLGTLTHALHIMCDLHIARQD
jgi:hypothetical protein